MAGVYTWYFLIIQTLAAVFAITFVILLLRQFIKKRTLGTILLTICFTFIAIGEILTGIGQYYYVIVGENQFTGIFELTFAFFNGIAYIFLYYFSNRHILQDKDFLRASTTIFLTILVSILSTLMIYEVAQGVVDSIFYDSVILAGPEVLQFLPNPIIGFGVFLPIFAFIHIRIIIKLVKIRRDVDNPIAKTGFTYILLSVLFMVLSTMMASFYTLPGIGDSPLFVGIIHTLRGALLVISIFLGYFGWILPDWLKKRIRGKAWIVQEMRKDITAKIEPIAGSNKTDTVAIEITET